MSTPALHFGLLRDIFAHFNRPELSQISETNRRVNAIIEKHFASSPLLIFEYVHYKNGVWKWIDTALNDQVEAWPMSDSQIAQLPTSKFLRFKISNFNFFENKFKAIMNLIFKKRNPAQWIMSFMFKQRSPLEMLKAHQHLWEGGLLRIFAMDFWCSKELASIVNTSHNLLLLAPGAFDVLPQLIRGSSKHIAVDDFGFIPHISNAVVHINTHVDSILNSEVMNSIFDWIFNYTKQLPLDDINNFLLDNACKNDQCINQSFSLKITICYIPKDWQEVVDSIKQKFLETPDPSEFCFLMLGEIDWHQQQDWTLGHPHSNKELRLEISDIRLNLTCSIPE
ncbi:hypothetical protein Ddc_17000 [Ditylenchus destructor]|nr:hypothetical protein Ddc_17000 [Ditylenchus destructor]